MIILEMSNYDHGLRNIHVPFGPGWTAEAIEIELLRKVRFSGRPFYRLDLTCKGNATEEGRNLIPTLGARLSALKLSGWITRSGSCVPDATWSSNTSILWPTNLTRLWNFEPKSSLRSISRSEPHERAPWLINHHLYNLLFCRTTNTLSTPKE